MTEYAVIVETSKGTEILGFTKRKTKATLVSFAQANSNRILAAIPESQQNDPYTYTKDGGFQFPAGVRVRFGDTKKTLQTLALS